MSNDLSTPAQRSNWLTHLPLLLIVLYFGWTFDGLLFMSDGLHEQDGFFNARYSQMLPERGLSRSFPWMYFTSWHETFSDHYFLYHLILCPACRGCDEALVGAKFMTNFMMLALMIVVYVLLFIWRVRWPALWVVVLAVCSGPFVDRMLSVRAVVFSASILLVGTYFVLKRRVWPCFGVAFIYAWSYSFPMALVLCAIAAEAGRFIATGKWTGAWKMPLAAASGILAGLIINPYSPNTLEIFWSIARMAALRSVGTNDDMPTEFAALRLCDLLPYMSGLTLMFYVAIGGAAILHFRCLKDRQLSEEAAAIVAVAAGWFSAMFVFGRMVEYAAPFSVMAAALIVRDLLGELTFPALAGLPGKLRSAVLFAPTLLLLFAADTGTREQIRNNLLKETKEFHDEQSWQSGRKFTKAVDWLRQHQKPHSVIVNLYFDDFPELYYDAPDFYYVTGMDPKLTSDKYPEEGRMIFEMRTQKIPIDFALLGTRFNSDYLILRRSRAITFQQLELAKPPESRHIRPAYEDGEALVYSLR